MKNLPTPWRFGCQEYDFNTGHYKMNDKPLDYKDYRCPSIYAANGEEVVGCDEYYIFHSPDVVRLFLAAPELLDALQKMCEFIDGEYGDIAKQLVRDMAQAAINKATGETK